ncbi:MAG: EAL domain-containing protein [Methylococcales bacterium]|nr:EAL domain-containing protein [Methylococcales bacterium]
MSLFNKRMFWYPIVAVAVMVSGWLSFLLKQTEFFLVSPIWPVAGVSVAALMLLGLRCWWAVAAGYFICEWYDYAFSPGHDALLAALFTLANLLQSLLAVRFSRRFLAPGVPELTHFAQVLRFIIMVGLVPALASTTIGMIVLELKGLVPEKKFWLAAWQWWQGDALGVLLVAPMIFSLFARPRKLWRTRRWFYSLPVLAAMLVMALLFRVVNHERIRYMSLEFDRESHAMGLKLTYQFERLNHNALLMRYFLEGQGGVGNVDTWLPVASTLMHDQPHIKAIHWLPVAREQLLTGTAAALCTRAVPSSAETFKWLQSFPCLAESPALFPMPVAEADLQQPGVWRKSDASTSVWLFYQPIHDAEQRLQGLVMIEFDLETLLGNITESDAQQRFALTMLKLDADGREMAVYQNREAPGYLPWLADVGEYQTRVALADVAWQLHLKPSALYERQHATLLPLLVFLLLALWVVLLLPLLLVGSGQNHRIAGQVKRRTRQLSKANQELLIMTGALEASNQHFRALLSNSPVPHVVVDQQGQVVLVNRAFHKAFGYDSNALSNFAQWQQQALQPLDVHESVLLFKTEVQAEFRLRHAQGGRCYVLRQEETFTQNQATLTLISFYDISARKTAEQALQVLAATASSSNEAFFAVICEQLLQWLDTSYLLIAVVDEQRQMAETVMVWSQQGRLDNFHYSLLGTPCERVIQGKLCEYPENVARHFPNDTMLESMGVESYIGVPLMASDGQRIGLLATLDCKPVRDPSPVRHILQSLAGRVAAEIERRQNQQQLELATRIFQGAHEAIITTNAKVEIIDVNPAFCQMSGYSREDALGKNPSFLKSNRHGPGFYQRLWEVLGRAGFWQGELWNVRQNGELYAQHGTISALKDSEGVVQYYIGMFTDVTEQKRQEELIWRQAHFDVLTDLPNRGYFQNHLEHELKRAERSGKCLALLFIDLDRFKEINDTLGHNAGDQLLKEVARRLQSVVRQTDTICRLGGDEFTVILPDLETRTDAEQVSTKILHALTQVIYLDQEPVHVSASIGMTFFPEDDSTLDSLVQNADQAMYAAKNMGRNRACSFTPVMKEDALRKMQLLQDLHSALELQQFHLLYQPIIDLATGAIVKAEALIRWRHPRLGLISPAVFIPLAEQSTLIVDIGQWVFQTVSRQLEVWRAPYYRDVQISVNVSPVQFIDDNNNLDGWYQALSDAGLSGQQIVIEITEGLLLDDNQKIEQRLLAFRDVGIQVAIDDFGTGYSSLAYLKKFDIDFLKIDQSFVKQLTEQSLDMALCEAIVVMAHKLGLKVIAEGVETETQYQLLKQIGCDFGQGYYIGKPMEAASLEALIVACAADTNPQAETHDHEA